MKFPGWPLVGNEGMKLYMVMMGIHSLIQLFFHWIHVLEYRQRWNLAFWWGKNIRKDRDCSNFIQPQFNFSHMPTANPHLPSSAHLFRKVIPLTHLDPRTPTLEETFTELWGFTISLKARLGFQRWYSDGLLVLWFDGFLFWLVPKTPKKNMINHITCLSLLPFKKEEPSPSPFWCLLSGFLFGLIGEKGYDIWLYDLVAKSCELTVVIEIW